MARIHSWDVLWCAVGAVRAATVARTPVRGRIAALARGRPLTARRPLARISIFHDDGAPVGEPGKACGDHALIGFQARRDHRLRFVLLRYGHRAHCGSIVLDDVNERPVWSA